MRYSRLFGVVACMLGQGLHAQQASVPIHPLGAIIATSNESVGNGGSVRVLSDGRALVNDPARQRLILFDSTLQRYTVVADTTSATAKAYGKGLIGLIPFFGDSSLTQDLVTGAFIVIDPTGKVARIIRAPGSDRGNAIGRFSATPMQFDHAGHLIVRESGPIYLALLDPSFVGDTLMIGPDSSAILRVDLTSGATDTIAMLRAPRVRQAVSRQGPGTGRGRQAFNPIPSGDDWTVMNDGAVAIARASDYHMDWVSPDRHVTSSPTIPVPRARLTDSMKIAIMDSIRSRDSAAVAASGRGGAPVAYVSPSDLPDFRPVFSAGGARADADGNIWIRTSSPAQQGQGLTFDVINRKGALVDRLRIPAGSSLAGFGPGVAYLIGAAGPARLTKARVH